MLNWKIATLGLVAAGMLSAPAATAAPSAGDINSAVGQSISVIAKNGGGSAAVLSQLQQIKTSNPGLATAVQNAVKNAQASIPATLPATLPSGAVDPAAVKAAVGQAISSIAKNGGGAQSILTQLQQLKPTNPGIANALSQLSKLKPPVTPVP